MASVLLASGPHVATRAPARDPHLVSLSSVLQAFGFWVWDSGFYSCAGSGGACRGSQTVKPPPLCMLPTLCGSLEPPHPLGLLARNPGILFSKSAPPFLPLFPPPGPSDRQPERKNNPSSGDHSVSKGGSPPRGLGVCLADSRGAGRLGPRRGRGRSKQDKTQLSLTLPEPNRPLCYSWTSFCRPWRRVGLTFEFRSSRPTALMACVLGEALRLPRALRHIQW